MRPAIEALLAGATIDGVARDDMIAGLQVPYILPDLLDDARRLMPHHGRNGEMGHCTLFEMQIAVTHAARRGPDKNLIIGGLVDLDRLDRNITAIFAEHRRAGLLTHYAFSLACPHPPVAPSPCSGSTTPNPLAPI